MYVNLTLYGIFFQRTSPEDGHSSWPKHAAGYADYTV